jgi:sRNA-binding protein
METNDIKTGGSSRITQGTTNSKRTDMKKALIAVTTAFIALTTMFNSAADAGFKARIGLGVLALAPHVIAASKANSAKRRYRKRKYQAAKRRRAKKKAYAKKRSSKRTTVTKVKKAPTVVDTSENENSTISMAMVETAENDTETVFEEEETVAENTAEVTPAANNSDQLGCKKFFAAVGMTLTVPCE